MPARRNSPGEMFALRVLDLCSTTIKRRSLLGLYLNQKGIKKVFMMGLNYAAGRDML